MATKERLETERRGAEETLENGRVFEDGRIRSEVGVRHGSKRELLEFLVLWSVESGDSLTPGGEGGCWGRCARVGRFRSISNLKPKRGQRRYALFLL